MKKNLEQFTSRFGLIAATLGMAIGAGNIWRFPRLAGQYGGTFILPWLIFLFLWSIPLLITEFSIGKKTRSGVIAAFKNALGKNYTWMGFFVAFCTAAIMFYYSVVCGWSFKYLILSLSGQIATIDHQNYWNTWSHSVAEPLFFHIFALIIASTFIFLGIVKGIERFSKIIIPSLFVLLVISSINAISLDNASLGLNYFFSFEVSKLNDHKIWLDGLSQSAWSTGAGWGLLLTYSVYAREKEKIVGNAFLAGIGNNFASILAGLVIIPTVFALSIDTAAAQNALASGNQGLAFIALPALFGTMSYGGPIASIFFFALFLAALSSLISMLEMATRILMDFGINRRTAVVTIASLSILAGAPSAISPAFFDNQDWVWGLGLMVSGFLFTLAVIKIGPARFVTEWMEADKYKNFFIKSFKVLFYFVIPLEFILMLGWWLYLSVTAYSKSAWDPLETYSLGTTLLQWLAVVIVGLILNKKLNQKLDLS